MKVVWAELAEQNRERIVFFIVQDSVDAALEMDLLFTSATDDLSTLPYRGRPGRLEGTRELIVHPRYILVYGCDEEDQTLYIAAVLHTSRQCPPE